MLAALVPISMLSVSKQILDAVQAKSSGAALPSYFWYLVALEFGLAATGALLGRAIGYFDALLADRFTRHVSVRVIEHASRLDLASYEDPVFYDKLERARVQATDRIAMIQAIGSILQQIIAATTLSVSIMYFSPWLMVLLLIAVVPAFLGESHFAFLGYALNIRQTPMRRELDYLRVLGASKESAKELKLFGLRRLHHRRVRAAFRRDLSPERQSRTAAPGGGRSPFCAQFGRILRRLRVRNIPDSCRRSHLGHAAVSGRRHCWRQRNIQNIFSTFSSIADQSLFLTALVDFFAVKPKIQSKPDAIPAPRPIRTGFVFEDVSFSYPNSGRIVLEHLNLRIAPGERIALIGENGQGKTTIVKLLTRLYDPTSGRILLDGLDLREYDMDDLNREIGVIFQDFMRYEMTVRQNIAIGRLERADHNGNVEDAARKSGADDLIRRLPKGYDQLLGRRFEGGLDLSGGEWQKIALARAYLRDAQLLILDEPTAALDARAEYEVFQHFAELTKGKMALLISHRFSTVRMADRIVVLQGGHVIEEGDHSDLIALGGRYSELFQLQASSYR